MENKKKSSDLCMMALFTWIWLKKM
jgi:hypothetical protein